MGHCCVARDSSPVGRNQNSFKTLALVCVRIMLHSF
ncbi:hypothetical protein I3843_Q062700 [Carya illinoinensis]|nr:hypothetical protein I3843_Q062700 [Carya illinoinensis]